VAPTLSKIQPLLDEILLDLRMLKADLEQRDRLARDAVKCARNAAAFEARVRQSAKAEKRERAAAQAAARKQLAELEADIEALRKHAGGGGSPNPEAAQAAADTEFAILNEAASIIAAEAAKALVEASGEE
jgi:hypothetical protein